MSSSEYSTTERTALIALGLFGLLGVNGAFLYGIANPEIMDQAMANPIALAFMAEALVLMAFFAYLLTKWGVMRLSWGWFVVLSLLGSMAFALPTVLLWGRKRGERAAE